MKSKTFIFLLLACAVLIGISYLVMGRDTVQQGKMGEDLLPDFPMDKIAGIIINSHDGLVKLRRGANKTWELENKFNYPANFSSISDFVKKLKDAKIGTAFKAEDETISRLALRDPDPKNPSEDEKATRVIIQDQEKKPIVNILLGKNREGGGNYVMLDNSDVIYMVDQAFRFLNKKPDEWLDKKLLEVKSEDVEKVTCVDTETQKVIYALKRSEKGQNPEFLDLPENKKAKKAKINTVLGALASLRIDDVDDPAKKPEETGLDKALCFEYHLFDGTIYKVYPGAVLKDDENKFYFKVQVDYAAPEIESKDEASPEEQKAQKQEQKNQEKLARDAEKLNEKINPWLYVISKWKHDDFITKVDELLEEKEVKKEEVKETAKQATPPEPKKVEVKPQDAKVKKEEVIDAAKQATPPEPKKVEEKPQKVEKEQVPQDESQAQEAESSPSEIEEQDLKPKNQKPQIGVQN